MNTNQLILIGAGAVALYFVWKKYGAGSGEDKAGAIGNPCWCQGQHIGYMSERKCKRMCKRAINVNR